MLIEAVNEESTLQDYPLGPWRMVYHWSPSDRQQSILEGGLRIRSKSAHAPIRFPFVAFGTNPLDSWRMSGGTFVLPEIESWDLWGVYAGDIKAGFEVIPYDDNSIREIRTYRSIPAKYVRYIATRKSSD